MIITFNHLKMMQMNNTRINDMSFTAIGKE